MIWNPAEPFDEDAVLTRFREGVFPFLKARGSEIGEKAMQGDALAEHVIRRYHMFEEFVDPFNLDRLESCVVQWKKRNEQ